MIIKQYLADRLYNLLFRCCSWLSRHQASVLLDIDNIVTNQQIRLLKFTRDGICDYRKANGFRELLRDEPLPNSVEFVSRLSQRFRIIWLTSRSIRTAAATFYWLRKNEFPVHALVCTGKLQRKIRFIRTFSQNHLIAFVVDDMKEGYESGKPYYVLPYKEYLDANKIRVYESLASAEMEV